MSVPSLLCPPYVHLYPQHLLDFRGCIIFQLNLTLSDMGGGLDLEPVKNLDYNLETLNLKNLTGIDTH